MQHKYTLTPIDEKLFEACKDLDFIGVMNALKLGANINAINGFGATPLNHTISCGDWYGIDGDTIYSNEEEQLMRSENNKRCREIAEFLLDNGADIDLFGFNGTQPLVAAYHNRNYEMVKFLLERGANPNINSYPGDIPHRSSLLFSIDELLYEDYNDNDYEVAKLARSKGGRLYDFDVNPHTFQRIGKSFVSFQASENDRIFSDNSRWTIGDTSEITFEDKNDHLITFKLPEIPGLQTWLEDYREHIDNPHEYDWKEWNQRGLKLAQEIADILPNTIALHYYYGHHVILYPALSGRYYISPEKHDLYIAPSK